MDGASPVSVGVASPAESTTEVTEGVDDPSGCVSSGTEVATAVDDSSG
jgi:hypothetical protein